MSAQAGRRWRVQVNVSLWLAVLLLLLGVGLVLAGVYLVAGLGWALIVGGAAVVALALTVVQT